MFDGIIVIKSGARWSSTVEYQWCNYNSATTCTTTALPNTGMDGKRLWSIENTKAVCSGGRRFILHWLLISEELQSWQTWSVERDWSHGKYMYMYFIKERQRDQERTSSHNTIGLTKVKTKRSLDEQVV